MGGMTNNENQPRDRKQTMIIVLAVVLTVLVGLIIGFVVSGGLSGDPVAEPTTLSTGTVAPSSPSTTTAAPAAPSTSLGEGQLAVTISEDTYVDLGQPEDLNGFEDVIEIENDPPDNKQALLRFVVPAIPGGEILRSVTMRLYVAADTEEPVTVHSVEGPWSQADVSGATAPGVGAQLATVPPGAAEGSTVDVDLTGVILGPGTYDFYLTTPSDDSAEYAALESGANAPLVILDWGSGTDASTSSDSETPTQLAGTPVVLAGAGDISDCDNEGDSITAGLIDEVVARDSSTIVFTTGDNVYPDGGPDVYAQCYDPTWGRHKDRTRPSPGNHDYNTDGATGYFGYFGQAAGEPGLGYYSYQAGEWQVISLNSNCSEVACDAGSPQEQWLREQLETSDASCTLAYWHHPLFSSGDHGGDDSMIDLFTALYEADAEIVVNGHDHNYERFAPQDPNGVHEPVEGVREFVVGTGGTGDRGFDAPVPNSEARYDESFGILQLSLYSDGYEWDYLPETGSTFVDLGVGACH